MNCPFKVAEHLRALLPSAPRAAAREGAERTKEVFLLSLESAAAVSRSKTPSGCLPARRERDRRPAADLLGGRRPWRFGARRRGGERGPVVDGDRLRLLGAPSLAAPIGTSSQRLCEKA